MDGMIFPDYCNRENRGKKRCFLRNSFFHSWAGSKPDPEIPCNDILLLSDGRDEMKKYMISRQVAGLYIFGLCVLVGAMFFWGSIYITAEDPLLDFSRLDWDFLCAFSLIAVPAIGALNAIYLLLFDYMLGKFSVNPEGITLYIGFKQYYHPWDSFKDFGIVGIRVRNNKNLDWVYFSTRHLTTIEKQLFLRKTRKDLENIAFFQYTADTLDEVLPLMPSHIAQKIREDIAFSKTGVN
jgi:hypothetical protein